MGMRRNGSDGEEERWEIHLHPAQQTDILVRVVDLMGGENNVVFTFTIGKLFLEEIEDQATTAGTIILDDYTKAIYLRWARQLEIYAELIRASLGPVADPEERHPA